MTTRNGKITERIKPHRNLEQTVFLNLQKTADQLMTEITAELKPLELSPTQYNVLRILRAAGPEGMPCGQIAQRMLTHDPDMTRLLDRLEKRGWIERSRDAKDRRVVRGRITGGGAKLLRSLDDRVLALHERQLSHLPRGDLKHLARLLETARKRT